jgi:4-hydroxy-3-methylbut-2-enyl diphosphate reductase
MQTALAEAEHASGRVYTLGPLIHNPAALNMLSCRGVGVLEEQALPEDLAGSVVVIRAHGVSPALMAEVASRGAKLVDATCPRVRLSQKKATNYSQAGYVLFLAGEADHGEIIGIAGHAPGCIVVSTPEEARRAASALFAEKPDAKTALIGQTTIKTSEYKEIADEIAAFFPALEIFDGICLATMERQDALCELCEQTDAVVIVGGRNSANTKRLYLSAVETGKPSFLIESAAELPYGLEAYERIGLTAGASTPDSVIDEVEAAIRSLSPPPRR